MFAKIAWRNLFLYWKKSLAALLSIITAFVSLSLFEAYIHDVTKMFEANFSQRQMFGDVLIERKDSAFPGRAGLDNEALTEAEQRWIDSYLAADGSLIRARVRFLNISGYIANGSSKAVFAGLAYDIKEGAAIRGPKYEWSTYAGMPLERSTHPYPLLLGKGLAEVFGCSTSHNGPQLNGVVGYTAQSRPFNCPDQAVQLQVNTERNQSNAMDFSVEGLVASGMSGVDEHLIMIPYSAAKSLYSTEYVSFMSVAFSSKVHSTEAWVKQFNRAAEESKQAVVASRWQNHELGRMYVDSIDFLHIFRNFVISIILMVVTMAILNTFVKIVSERTREIGTLRSIGYRPSSVLAIFGGEALLLAIAGSLAGLGCSYLLQIAFNAIGLTYKAGFLSEKIPFHVTIDARDFVWITALVVILTLLSTLAACFRTTRMPIAVIMADK